MFNVSHNKLNKKNRNNMKSYKFYIMFLSVLLTVGFASRAESVVDVIVNSPNHTILETALIEANLVDDLEGSGSFTVFAPTDAAFNALPEGTLEALLAPGVALQLGHIRSLLSGGQRDRQAVALLREVRLD